MEIEYQRTRDYLQAISANLLAGDIQSRVVSNDLACSVEVKLIDGSRVYWSNYTDLWTYTLWSGSILVGHETLPWDICVDDAAKMIAMHDYPVSAEFPIEHPGDEA